MQTVPPQELSASFLSDFDADIRYRLDTDMQADEKMARAGMAAGALAG